MASGALEPLVALLHHSGSEKVHYLHPNPNPNPNPNRWSRSCTIAAPRRCTTYYGATYYGSPYYGCASYGATYYGSTYDGFGSFRSTVKYLLWRSLPWLYSTLLATIALLATAALPVVSLCTPNPNPNSLWCHCVPLTLTLTPCGITVYP